MRVTAGVLKARLVITDFCINALFAKRHHKLIPVHCNHNIIF
jgi:hypothetical protein